MTERLVWWLRRESIDRCSAAEMKGFLCYVTTGHNDPGGRYGIPSLTKLVRSRTVKDTPFDLLMDMRSACDALLCHYNTSALPLIWMILTMLPA